MVSEVCRAKDPRTCPYHGAVLRMYEAQAVGDFDAYFAARTAVEKAKAENWAEPEAGIASLEEKLGINKPVAQSGKVFSTDPRVQNGEVLDEVYVVDPRYPAGVSGEDNVTKFVRIREDIMENEPQYIRIQANRKLDAAGLEKMATLLGYHYRTTIAGEPLGEPYQDSPYSFVVFADTTKGRMRDFGKFEGEMNQVMVEGSPPYKTNRKGPIGSRAIDGFNDEDLKVEIYYDSVETF